MSAGTTLATDKSMPSRGTPQTMSQGRQRHFRGVKVLLECGHEAVLSSSWWKLSKGLINCIVGSAVRRGVYCHDPSHQHKPCCQVVEVIGTVRL